MDDITLVEEIVYEKSMFFIKIVALMFGSIFAGYTASNIDPKFLKLFGEPLMQFVTFFLIAFSFFDSDFSKWWIMLIAAISFTIVFRLGSSAINKFMKRRGAQKLIADDKRMRYTPSSDTPSSELADV